MSSINLSITPNQFDIEPSLENNSPSLDILSDSEKIIEIDLSVMDSNLNIEIEDAEEIDMDFGLNGYYTLNYEPVPTVDGFSLPTADKLMLRDIYVQPIPVKKVSNESGGKTCFLHDGTKFLQRGKMAFVAAVGEIEAGSVHSAQHECTQSGFVAGGGA